MGGTLLAARGKSPPAFEGCFIPPACVASRSNTGRYAPVSRLGQRAPHPSRCDAGFHHGLLGNRQTPGAGDLIDSVLAVAEGQVIMLSDVRAFLDLRLIEPPDAGDPVPPVLTALIERQLILEEVDRYVVDDPSIAEVDTRLGEVVERLGGPEALGRVLPVVGFTVEDLSQVLRDNLRIERYLARRFVSARQPTQDEVALYFREHADDFRVDGTPVPFDAVRDEARRRLSESLRQELIDDWIASLTARADVFRVSP